MDETCTLGTMAIDAYTHREAKGIMDYATTNVHYVYLLGD